MKRVLAIKQALRKEALTARQALSVEKKRVYSARIVDSLKTCVAWESIRVAHLYAPCEQRGEVNIRSLFVYLWEKYPSIITVSNRWHQGHYEAAVVHKNAAWHLNALGIWEPDKASATVAFNTIDVMIIPLLVSDYQGTRLGYGKGIYDQLLAQCKPDVQRIGVHFFPPSVTLIPQEPHDQPLDVLVTPGCWYRFKIAPHWGV